MDRKDFLKISAIIGGAAMLPSNSVLAANLNDNGIDKLVDTEGNFTLLALPYNKNFLEPYMDEEPVSLHYTFHHGIDLAVALNTPIKSPMPGIVDAVTSGGDGGNQVIIKHDNGFKTGYAHLSKQLVKKGDKVKQGDVIGLSGSTGKSTGPHLHLTLTDPSGAKVDPQKVIYSGVV